jgi:glucose/arabinose dehydrogenase
MGRTPAIRRRQSCCALFKKWGVGGIIRMDRDSKNREVYAGGIRNSVGLDFNPKDKTGLT